MRRDKRVNDGEIVTGKRKDYLRSNITGKMKKSEYRRKKKKEKRRNY